MPSIPASALTPRCWGSSYLASGALVYLFAEADRKDAVKVCQILKDEAINVAIFPTQMGEIIIDNMSGPSDLTHIIVGGEKLKHYYDRPYIVVNAYGPTESTVETTFFNVDQEYRNYPDWQIADQYVRSYVVDEQLAPVPVRMPGELCHAGRQIARSPITCLKKPPPPLSPTPLPAGLMMA